MSATVVRLATAADQDRWDEYVLSSEKSTFFHRFGWRGVLRDVFALEPLYLVAERNGCIRGVLPLVYQKSMLFGTALISTPFCVEGGPLGNESETVDLLRDTAINYAKKLRVSSLEFRSRNASNEGWTVKRGLYATFARELFSDDKANLLAIPRKQRAVIRKTLEGSLYASMDRDLPAFFRVYSESMRNLGTPMFPLKYFDCLLKTFPENTDIVLVRDGNLPISAVFNFYYKDTVLPYYGGGTMRARQNGANDLLYWEVMRHAVKKGCKRFDFGRSKVDTGAFSFKKNWGFEPQWLEYEYWLAEGAKMPEKNPKNPTYASFIEAWKKLPLPVANFIGPFLIRGLG